MDIVPVMNSSAVLVSSAKPESSQQAEPESLQQLVVEPRNLDQIEVVSLIAKLKKLNLTCHIGTSNEQSASLVMVALIEFLNKNSARP